MEGAILAVVILNSLLTVGVGAFLIVRSNSDVISIFDNTEELLRKAQYLEDNMVHVRSYVDDRVREKADIQEMEQEMMESMTEEVVEKGSPFPPIQGGDSIHTYKEKCMSDDGFREAFPDEIYASAMAEAYYRIKFEEFN